LNSQVYDANRHSFVGKPVLSFLRPDRYEPGPILGDVVRGVRCLKTSTQLYVVCVLMRHEICVRGVTSSCAELGPWWRRQLLPRRWFRAAALVGPAPVKERGVNREVPVRLGPVPVDCVLDFVSSAAAGLQRERVEEWSGRRVKPLVRFIDRKSIRNWSRARGLWRLSSRFSFGGWRWRFLWPSELLSFFEREFPQALKGSVSVWRTDHPFLTRVPVFLEDRRCQPWKNPVFAPDFTYSCADWFRE
jgi:hypothetical protein